ncbi:MAG: hypothetical protein ABL949_12775 [Fimbriimonadaceae bacterium]
MESGRLLFSIPVHEQPKVVRDQIDNVLKFNPGSVIVLHISQSFSALQLATSRLMRESKNVFVNPERFDTSKQGLFPIHFSNYRYARNKADFSHFVIHSSNDMYVRSGLASYLGEVDAAVRPMPAEGWTHAPVARQHAWLQDAITRLGMSFLASTPEGTAYSKAVLSKVDEFVGKDYKKPEIPYPDEETILPLLASKFAERIVNPTTFSEVTMAERPAAELIEHIRLGKFRPEPRGFYNGEDLKVPYDEVFSVKRVARKFEDPLRTFIRGLEP